MEQSCKMKNEEEEMEETTKIKRKTTRWGRYFPISSTLVDMVFLTKLTSWTSDSFKFTKDWGKVDKEYANMAHVNALGETMWWLLKIAIWVYSASFVIFAMFWELPTIATYGMLRDASLKIFGKWNWFLRIIAIFLTLGILGLYIFFIGSNMPNPDRLV